MFLDSSDLRQWYMALCSLTVISVNYWWNCWKINNHINNIQLSPTVKATKSNYLRAHGGKKTKFIDYFIKKTKDCKDITSLKL